MLWQAVLLATDKHIGEIQITYNCSSRFNYFCVTYVITAASQLRYLDTTHPSLGIGHWEFVNL